MSVLEAFFTLAASSIDFIDVTSTAMRTRAAQSVSRLRAESDRVQESFDGLSTKVASAARRRCRHLDDKVFGERNEEVDTNARMLDAVFAAFVRANR